MQEGEVRVRKVRKDKAGIYNNKKKKKKSDEFNSEGTSNCISSPRRERCSGQW